MVSAVFENRDLNVRFKDNAANVAAGSYQVECICATETITKRVAQANFLSEDGDGTRHYHLAFTFEEIQRAGITRTPTLHLRTISGDGHVSSKFAVIPTQNPAPVIAVAPDIIPTFDGALVKITEPQAKDLVGYVVAVSLSATFDPSNPNTWTFKGPNPAPTITLPDTHTYFVRCAAYDVFGTDQLVWTTATAVAKQTSDLSEITEFVSDVQEQFAGIVDLSNTLRGEIALQAGTNIEYQLDLVDERTERRATTFIDGQPIDDLFLAEQERTDGLMETIDAIVHKTTDGSGYVLNVNTVRWSDTQTVAEHIAEVAATTGDATAALALEQSTRAAADLAESTTRQTQVAELGDNIAQTLVEARAYTDTTKAYTDNTFTTKTTFNNNKAAVQTVLDSLSTAQTSEANLRIALAATVETNRAYAEGRLNVLTSAQAAEVTSRQQLAALVDSNKATSDASITLLTNAKNAQATSISQLQTDVAGNQTLALQKYQTFSDFNTAQVTTNNLFQAQFAGNQPTYLLSQLNITSTKATGAVTTLESIGTGAVGTNAYKIKWANVVSTDGTALSTTIDGLQASMGAKATTSYVDAQINDTKSAAVALNSATVTSVNTLRTTVGQNTADITQLFSSTNGLGAKYGLALNVNNYVTGFQINNGGTAATSNFVISAPNFAIAIPGRTVVPFSIGSDGVVRMPSVEVDSIKANTVTTGTIVTNSVSTTLANTGTYGGNYGNSGSTAQVVSITIVCTGRPIHITGMYSARLTVGPGNINATGVLLRNGGTIQSAGAYAPKNYDYSLPFDIVDNPGPGTWTYSLNDTVGYGAYTAFYNYSLSAVELKV